MKGYGEKIREYRKKNNITQEQLSNLLGVGASTIAMYENEERVPRDCIKVKIAKLIGSTVQKIFFTQ